MKSHYRDSGSAGKAMPETVKEPGLPEKVSQLRQKLGKGQAGTEVPVLRNAIAKWEAVQHWKQALNHFEMLWGDRIKAATGQA